MKSTLPTILAICCWLASPAHSAEGPVDADAAANTVILDEQGVKNLRIETVTVRKQDFETTVFAIGRIEDIPSSRSVLSSRISGRAVEVNAFEGDRVEKDQVLVKVESRQPGNPPPTIALRAPKAGLVIESHVRLGEPIEPETELLDISDRSHMWAIAKIPEKEASGVVVGTTARIHVPAIGGEPITAKLSRYRVAADREAGTVDAIFEIDNADGKLQPGMRVEFSIIIASRSDVVAVPRTAIQGDPAKRVVFTKHLEIPNAFVKFPVQLGEQNDRYVEVISGLFPGEEVVTQGSYSLGFAGGDSGISLKEALDAAHGHEHAEDGSELTDADRAAKADNHAGHDHGDSGGGSGKLNLYLQIYAGVVTLMLLITLQQLWNKRCRKSAEVTPAG